jgi:hypothetical protein
VPLPDTLTIDPVLRPSFRDGQVLRAVDLAVEGADRVQAIRRHQALAHRPGVVAGLHLKVAEHQNGQKGCLKVTVSPGMAIDAAGRTILVGRDHVESFLLTSAAEVWISYRQLPREDVFPVGPPDRYSEGFALQVEQPAEFDPAHPEDHPDNAVLLGLIVPPGEPDAPCGTTVGNGVSGQGVTGKWKIHEYGRVYVGAIGARLEAASRRSRILLGSDAPDDLRPFAIGTRADAAQSSPYVDRVMLDASGTLHLLSPGEVIGHRRIAQVRVAHVEVEFFSCDVLHPLRLADLVLDAADPIARHLRQGYREGDDRQRDLAAVDITLLDALRNPGSPAVNRAHRVALILCRILNREILRDRLLLEQVLNSRVQLSPETSRLVVEHAASLPRSEPLILRRRLLEDVFDGLLRRLPEQDDRLRGISFVGSRPAPEAARPGGMYLATVTEKEETRRELRIEFKDPGKDNNPERYKVAIGIVGPDPDAPHDKSTFTPVITVDGSRTVTIPNLQVFTDETGARPGLILLVKPPRDPDDPALNAQQLTQVAPWDLVMEKVETVRVLDSPRRVVIKLELRNTGLAPIIGVQVHAVLFSPLKPEASLTFSTLARNLVIHPSPSGKLPLGEDPEVSVPIHPDVGDADQLTLLLKAIGVGPANVLTEVGFPPITVSP